MKKRRKHSNCLNCGHRLKDTDNFCPNCGQENTDNEVGVGLLFREFISNFFSLDSRFGRTLKPFLFSPGKVTNSFNAGKRMMYANPIRWYIVISIFHFFFFSRVIDPSETKGRAFVVNGSDDGLSKTEFDSLYYLPDSLHTKDDWPVSSHYMKLIDELNREDELSPTEIMDSLKLQDLPYVRKLATKQAIKINHESSSSLIFYIIGQIPVIMFFILPLYAFILKVFYWKRGLYIKHLVHSLHIHSFFYFVSTLAYIVMLIYGDGLHNKGPMTALAITSVYIVISFRKVYKSKWVWTIFKFFTIGFIYTITLSIALTFGVLISLAFF